MVNAKLLYNPYLPETKVQFNGQPPRINSLIEKYQDGTLQSWVSLIPRIFYDEMNGCDFNNHDPEHLEKIRSIAMRLE